MAGVSGPDYVPLPTGDDAWRAAIAPEQYRITRVKGTEKPLSRGFVEAIKPGVYRCVCCGTPLFDANAKSHSSSGWPSFAEPISAMAVKTSEDYSLGLRRTEVLCAKCDAHLGHVFDDGPKPAGLRYCINSAALRFEQKAADPP